MTLELFFALALVLGATNDPVDRHSQLTGPSPGSSPGIASSGSPQEPPASEVCEGDLAPNFSYQGTDDRWRRLKDITGQGPVLLVFGADEPTLRVLEHERESLLDLGVIPVAVVGMRARAARGTVQRFDLRYTVLSDPQGVIATQFNTLDPVSGRHLPAWFVLDTGRRVRGLSRKPLPPRSYPALAAAALGLPAKGGTVPAAK